MYAYHPSDGSPVAWTFNGAIFCAEHEPLADDAAIVAATEDHTFERMAETADDAAGCAFCPVQHDPAAYDAAARRLAERHPVFEWNLYGDFEDGGAECDRCGAIIVEDAYCRLEEPWSSDTYHRADEHDRWTYGPSDRLVSVDLCPDAPTVTLLVRDAGLAPLLAAGSPGGLFRRSEPFALVGTSETVIPAETVDEALDLAAAAWSARVATFAVVDEEEAAYAL
jgi:hypothetical protein